jgi:single-strand DNA-binding protein
MASVNRVILIGNLGKDPEVRYIQDGKTAICMLVLATSRKFKDANGEWKDEVEWNRVSLFRARAEAAGKYLKKGSPVYVEGHLRTRKYTDKQGVERYQTEVVCESMQFLGSKQESNGRSQSKDDDDIAF